MTNYLIEFALIHLLLFGIYKLLLRKETQVAFLRGYLLFSTLLALTLPLINIPVSSNIDVTSSVSSILLPEIAIGIPTEVAWYSDIGFITWIIIAVSLLVCLRLIIALSRIGLIYKKSEAFQTSNRTVRHSAGLDASFTFFALIFIDRHQLDGKQEIILHEEAHIKYGHSYDLLFLNLMTIPFWWVPSIWLTLRELKQLHEYQADAYVLNSKSYPNYKQTLITYCLKEQGFILTSSFNDTPLTKRLNFMKKFKKNISPWKFMVVLIMLSATFYTFSCQEISTEEIDDQVIKEEILADDKIFQIVDNPPVFPTGMTEFYSYVGSSLQYTDEALKAGVGGKIFVQFVVNTDGTIGQVVVLRGLGLGLDEEAIRVVANSPTWTPGSQKGHKVKVRLVLPITFSHPDYPIDKSEFRPFEEVEIKNMPMYPGGTTAFYNYIAENMKYPKQAKNMGLEGKVFVQFKVNTDGSISDVTILRGIGAGCDAEAKRVMENSPKWDAAKIDGKVREMTMVMPITFRLTKNSGATKVEVEEIEIPVPQH